MTVRSTQSECSSLDGMLPPSASQNEATTSPIDTEASNKGRDAHHIMQAASQIPGTSVHREPSEAPVVPASPKSFTAVTEGEPSGARELPACWPVSGIVPARDAVEHIPVHYVQVVWFMSVTWLLLRSRSFNVCMTPPLVYPCLLYTSPSPRDQRGSRMPSSA